MLKFLMKAIIAASVILLPIVPACADWGDPITFGKGYRFVTFNITDDGGKVHPVKVTWTVAVRTVPAERGTAKWPDDRQCKVQFSVVLHREGIELPDGLKWKEAGKPGTGLGWILKYHGVPVDRAVELEQKNKQSDGRYDCQGYYDHTIQSHISTDILSDYNLMFAWEDSRDEVADILNYSFPKSVNCKGRNCPYP